MSTASGVGDAVFRRRHRLRHPDRRAAPTPQAAQATRPSPPASRRLRRSSRWSRSTASGATTRATRCPPARRSRSTRPTSRIPAPTPLTWERVVKKLGVGAMPPQGSPTPGAAELTRFRASLITSLDARGREEEQPGKFVLHRLNRTRVRERGARSAGRHDRRHRSAAERRRRLRLRQRRDGAQDVAAAARALSDRRPAGRRARRRRCRRRAGHRHLHHQHRRHAEPARRRAAARHARRHRWCRTPFPPTASTCSRAGC